MKLQQQPHAETATEALLRTDILTDVHYLSRFIGKRQLAVMGNACYQDDTKDAMIQNIRDMAKLIRNMPTINGGGKHGDDALVYLHYFNSSMDFFVTEKDTEEHQNSAFGLANIGYGGELTYISIMELVENNVELDLHFNHITLRVAKGTFYGRSL